MVPARARAPARATDAIALGRVLQIYIAGSAATTFLPNISTRSSERTRGNDLRNRLRRLIDGEMGPYAGGSLFLRY